VSVTEAKQAAGTFDVALSPQTPTRIVGQINTLGYGGRLSVFPGNVGPAAIDTAPQLARYAGMVLHTSDTYGFGGVSNVYYLGESAESNSVEQYGPVASTGWGGTFTITQWVDAILSTNACILTRAFVSSGLAAGTTKPGLFVRKTPKTVLDKWLCPTYRVNYRVNPDYTLDTGTPDDLWPFVAPFPMIAPNAGSDLGSDGIELVEVHNSVDWSDVLLSRTIAVVDSPAAAGIANNPTPLFRSPLDSSLLNYTRVIAAETSGQASTAAAQTDAESQANTELDLAILNRELEVTVKTNRRIQPGEFVYLFHQDFGLFDSANPLRYGADLIYPVKIRASEVEWPFREGMGVYLDLRYNGGDLIDLTPYMMWESDQDVRLKLGRAPRTMGASFRRRR
jgi:hypothetical protein